MSLKNPCKKGHGGRLTALTLILTLTLFISCATTKPPKVVIEPPPEIHSYHWVENPDGGACIDAENLGWLEQLLDKLFARTRYLYSIAKDLGATDKSNHP